MGLQNKKSLGQHWLKDRVILDKIAKLAQAENAKLCLEIGPGLGFLTSSLLKIFPRVLALELDEKLAKNLPGSFPGKNLEVIHADFLDFDLETVPAPFVAAGNIPYYITSPIITKLLESKNKPTRIVLLVQKEVAERISDARSYFSLFVHNSASVSLGPVVKRELFTPPPKVDSQVIILEPYASPVISAESLLLAKRAFSAPRKKLVHNLSPFYPKTSLKTNLMALGLSPDARPADLSLENWQSFYQVLTV